MKYYKVISKPVNAIRVYRLDDVDKILDECGLVFKAHAYYDKNDYYSCYAEFDLVTEIGGRNSIIIRLGEWFVWDDDNCTVLDTVEFSSNYIEADKCDL